MVNNKFKKLMLVPLFAMSVGLGGCASTDCNSTLAGAKNSDNDTVFQVALLHSLIQGYYDEVLTVGELKRHGNFGLGTFEGVNGEMIVLDGVVHQALHDGSVVLPDDSEPVPFSNVTYFDDDITVEFTNVKDMNDLQQRLNQIVTSNGKNLLYAVKITGKFSMVKARSEYKQQKPYRRLDEALKTDQVEFEFKDVDGTVVGLYFPDYLGNLNAKGWHFHVITADRTKGGHMFDIAFDKAEVVLDTADKFEMYIPRKNDFQKMNLAEDVTKAIEKAEKNVD